MKMGLTECFLNFIAKTVFRLFVFQKLDGIMGLSAPWGEYKK